MKKFVCTVCGYVYEGEAAPAECPQCHVGADKFKEMTGEREWAAEHVPDQGKAGSHRRSEEAATGDGAGRKGPTERV